MKIYYVRLWSNVNVSRVCFLRIRLEHILCQVRLWSNINASRVFSKDKARNHIISGVVLEQSSTLLECFTRVRLKYIVSGRVMENCCCF